MIADLLFHFTAHTHCFYHGAKQERNIWFMKMVVARTCGAT